MLASLCRRRRLLLAVRQVFAGGDGGTRNRIHPSPSTIPLSHISFLTAAAPNFEPCPTTVSYLVSCGVSPATAAARRVRIRDTAKADAVRDLLREYGFSDAEVTRTVRTNPLLLTLHPDRILRPKLDFLLVSLGLRRHVIVREPCILTRSLDKHLVPCIDFLRGILGTDHNLGVAVSRCPRALRADLDQTMRPAVEALRRHGLSEESIAKLLRIQLSVIIMPVHRIAEIFEDLKALGICVTQTNFIYTFRTMCFLTRETWQRKVALFGSLGVTEDVLIRAFKRQPTILGLSEETVKKKLSFFLDILKVELNSIMEKPRVLCLSLEKCLKPRCPVLSLLIREGKLEGKPKLLAALDANSKVFSEKFVFKYVNEMSDVVKAFEGKMKFEGFGDREIEFFSSQVTECKSQDEGRL